MKITIEPTNYAPNARSDQKWLVDVTDSPREHHTSHRTIDEALSTARVIMTLAEEDGHAW